MSTPDTGSHEPSGIPDAPPRTGKKARAGRGRWAIRAARIIESIRAVPKTLLFNLWYFPLATALRTPVVVRHTVRFRRLGGTLHLPDNCRRGSIKLGFGDAGHFDRERERTVWNVAGTVSLGQKVRIQHGARISVGSEGKLTLGDSVEVTAGAAVICNKSVSVGQATRIAWGALVMDTDYHQIIDTDGRRTNDDAPVRIGARVWIGTRVIVLKGSEIADGCVVGAGAVINRRYEEKATLIGGVPGRVLRHGVAWQG